MKTDRVDVEKLLDLLIRHHCFGLRKAFRVVRVPCAAAEAAQRLHREDEYLLEQRTRTSNRIKGLLVAQGVVEVPLRGDFSGWLDQVRLWNGEGLSEELKTELRRMHSQYAVFDSQLKELANDYAEELLADTPVAEKRRQLEVLKGIGSKSSRPLSAEVFAWRRFANTKQVGAMSSCRSRDLSDLGPALIGIRADGGIDHFRNLPSMTKVRVQRLSAGDPVDQVRNLDDL